MAVEERVVIKVEIDADINKDLAAIERRIKALEDRTKSFNKTNRDLDKTTDKLDRRFNRMGNALKGFMGIFTKFITMMGKFSFIALAGQLALFTAGLLAAKAALITGRAAVKLYDVALKGLSVTAAAVATALAVAAGAMRQFQEAQMAPLLGGGMGGMRRARNFTSGISSRNLGLMGGESSGAITQSLARSGIRGSQANALITQLINLAGGDAKAAQQLAASISTKNFSAASEAIKGAQGFRGGSLAGVSTFGGLISTVSAGGATADAYQGAGRLMADTFMGTMKTQFAGVKNLFADMGEPLLGPFRNAFLQISSIIKNDIITLTAVIQRFGAESFAPTLVSVVDSISKFIKENILKDLANIEKMGESFVGFFRAVKNFFTGMGDFFGKFEPAANVLIDVFRAFGSGAGGRGLFRQFNELILDNADNFKKFGEAFGSVIGALFDQLKSGQGSFFEKLPLISEVLDKVATRVIPAMFNLFNTILPVFDQLPSILDGLAQAMNMLAPIMETIVDILRGLLIAIERVGALVTAPFGGGGGGFMQFAAVAGMAVLGKKAGLFSKAGRGAMAARGGAKIATGARNVAGNARTFQAARSTALSRNAAAGGGRIAGQVRGARSGANAITKGSKLGSGFANMSKFARGTGILTAGFSAFEVGQSAFNAAQTGQFTGSGMLSGAIGGATIGSMILPVVGTAIGAAVGTLVGGIAEGVGALIGQSRKKKRGKKEVSRLMGIADEFEVGSGFEKFEEQRMMAESFGAAIEAAVDDDGKFTADGDTREFADFLRSMGIDPDSVHRDNMMAALSEEGLMDQVLENMENAQEFYIAQIDKVASATGQTAEQIAGFMEAFGIDGYSNLNLSGVSVLAGLHALDPMDRTQSFVGDIDFATSAIGRSSRNASANAAYNAFIQGGMTDESALLDFIEKGAVAEVAQGGSADLAGLSMLLFLQEAQARGDFGSTDVMANFGIGGQIESQISSLAQAHGVSVGDLELALAEGGTLGVDNFLKDTEAKRSVYKKGIFEGDISALGTVMDTEQQNAFMRYARQQLIDVSGLEGSDRALGYSAQNQLQTLEQVEALAGEGASQLMIDYLTETGQYEKDANVLLQEIVNNTKLPPQILIEGGVDEGAGVATLRIDVQQIVEGIAAENPDS